MEKVIVKKIMDDIFKGNFICGQVGSDGSLLLIYSEWKELDYFERPVVPRNWTVYIINKTGVIDVKLNKVPLIPTHVDLFTDGTILIVQSRCEKNGMYIEKNAQIFDMNGNLLSSFTLGDGIEHVQIDKQDTIWVGYFDEGVFGNFGWDNDPIGQEGLVAFNKNGEKFWEGIKSHCFCS